MSAELELQKGLLLVLGATIPNAFGVPAPVFDDVAQDTPAPYVTVPDATLSDYSGDGFTGFNVLVTIHTWSDYRGSAEVKGLQGKIYDLLNRAELVVTGFNVLGCDSINGNVLRDPNGVTRHGVQQFRVLMTKV